MGDTFIDYPSYTQPILDFPDRRRGLTGFGIVLIVIGCLCACFALLTPLVIFTQGMTPSAGGQPALKQRPADLLVGGAMYVGLATLFIWTGIGSLKKRRWSRSIILIVAWTWLLT